MAENEVQPPVLGIGWDGTGFGTDGTIWGGEYLQVTADSFERVGHFRQFRLPGGEKAVREPRRAALGILYELFGDEVFEMDLASIKAFSPPELAVIGSALRRSLSAPLTSSAGRLFDAVASLIGLHQVARFEGQAAMALEFLCERVQTGERYEMGLKPFRADRFSSPALSERDPSDKTSASWVADWEPMIKGILEDLKSGGKRKLAPAIIAAKFHNTLVAAIVAMAQRIEEPKVVLSGGCFQNRYLTETAVEALRSNGFRPYWHQRIPPNDGGIALGQIVAAARQKQ
jgi:hydrogenase maturation protein HypF